MRAHLRNGRMCHLTALDPYRTNTAPLVRKWNGRLSSNQGQAGSPSPLRFAEDGGVVNIETGEYVETRPFLSRQPPARPVRVVDGAARRESPLVLVIEVIAAVVIGVGLMLLCGHGGFGK